MDKPLVAVLVYEHPDPLRALSKTLMDLSVEYYGARTWDAATVLIGQYQPVMIFVEITIWSKTRDAIMRASESADHPFSTIVVGCVPDIELYVSTIEQGAFNFVAPPFSHDILTPVLQTATVDAQRRRDSRMPSASLAHK